MFIVKWKDYKHYVRNKKPFCCNLPLSEEIKYNFSITYNADKIYIYDLCVYVSIYMHLYFNMILNKCHRKFMIIERGKENPRDCTYKFRRKKRKGQTNK